MRGALGDRVEPLAGGAVDEQDVLVVVERELREAGGDEQRDLVAGRGLGAAWRLGREQRPARRGVEHPLGLGDQPVVGQLLREVVDLGAGDRRDDDVLRPPPPPPPPPPPAPPPPAPPPAFGSLPLPLPLGSAKKMSIGAPSLTTSFSAGIWLSILPFGSGGVGEVCPTVSFFSRSAASASASVEPDDLRDADLAVADGDQHGDLLALLGLLTRGRGLADDRAGRGLGVDLLLRGRGELELGVGQLLLGVEGGLGADEVGHHDVLGQHQVEQHRQRGERDPDRHHPPGQPGLLAEHALRGQQRAARRGRRGALAGQLQRARVEVHALHLRALELRARHLRLAEGDAAGADVHARLVDLRLVHPRPVHAGHVARRAAPEQALLPRRRLRRALQLGGGGRLGGEPLLGLLARQGDRR